ncbi:MAG TPA: hypothetical protein VHY18_09280 [Solirubrobacteraceae bacterium]|nr:hypothetical protein [Solirubrobacteraceae bacterium]
MTYQVELFCEDNAHESCARAVIGRVARELTIDVNVHVASARFGFGRLKSELRDFQASMQNGSGIPDLLVVMADGNDAGPRERHREVADVIDQSVFPRYIVGAPDPYVERWLLADPVSFAQRFGCQPVLGTPHNHEGWKQRLVATLEEAGEIVTQGGAEFAEEIIDVMDFYRAGQTVPTIQAFADDVRSALRNLSS